MAGPAVRLRPPQASDVAEFLDASRASKALHGRWVSAPQTAEQFAGYLERMQGPAHQPLLVCELSSGAIAGVINISNIVQGAFRSAYLGYYAFAGFERRGMMREGLRATARLAFGRLGLHRLEANIQPGNVPSIALARSCGFVLEGYSPAYLKINGRWRDHERWALRAGMPLKAAAPAAGGTLR